MKRIKMLIEKQQSQRIEELLKEEADLPEGYVKIINERVEEFIKGQEIPQIEQYQKHIPKLYEIQPPRAKDAEPGMDVEMTVEEPRSLIPETQDP